MSNGNYDTTEKVERTDKGYRLTVESTRGTGTRDQDKVKAEARAETLQRIIQDRQSLNHMVEQAMDERRSHHPDDGDSDD